MLSFSQSVILLVKPTLLNNFFVTAVCCLQIKTFTSWPHERYSWTVQRIGKQIKGGGVKRNEWEPEACLINLVWGGRVNRTEPNPEHFLAWLCCVFFRISFIQVKFFHVRQKYKNNNCMQDILLFDTGFFCLCIYEWLLFKQAFNLSQICHHDSGIFVQIIMLLYTIWYGGIWFYHSIKGFAMCPAMFNLYMYCTLMYEITWNIYRYLNVLHTDALISSNIILANQWLHFILIYLIFFKSTWLIAFYVCIVYSMAFILCNIYTYSRTNFLAFGCV